MIFEVVSWFNMRENRVHTSPAAIWFITFSFKRRMGLGSVMFRDNIQSKMIVRVERKTSFEELVLNLDFYSGDNQATTCKAIGQPQGITEYVIFARAS